MSLNYTAALRCKCPHCGDGSLFEMLLRLHSHCPSCGHEIDVDDAADGPAYTVMFLVAIVVTALAVLVEAIAQWPMWLHVLAWLPLTIGLSIWWLHPAKALFIHLNYVVKGQ